MQKPARVAFYAPMKQPYHPQPSGDRAMARALLQLLRKAGFAPFLASRLRSYDGRGDARQQQHILARAIKLRQQLANRPPMADYWLTYHHYHKAPDLIGPWVAAHWQIPYILVEASYAQKRAQGPWGHFLTHSKAALAQASLILQPNPADHAGIAPFCQDACQHQDFPAFIDMAPLRKAYHQRASQRATLAAATGANPQLPWVCVAAMMRPGDKQASYRLLAESLAHYPSSAPGFALLVAGDGAARADIMADLAAHCPSQVSLHGLGLLPEAAIPAFLGAGDIYFWPGVNEAYGLALLKAMAAGLACISGDGPGIRTLLRDHSMGMICPHDPTAFATALEKLTREPDLRRNLGEKARAAALQQHDLAQLAGRMAQLLPSLAPLPASPILWEGNHAQR